MQTTATSRLKEEWMQFPEECFETLTFGELATGQQFICLPQPGDNHGHGGLKGAHWLFTKTEESVLAPEGSPYHKDFPHGRAMNNKRQVASDFPLSMPVILVE